jgi:Tol biopolymer transport system component
MPEAKRSIRVFLCHASQDKPAVRELYQRLKKEGWIDPWLDEEKLTLGQHWTSAIEDALDAADVVVIFLSQNSVQKEGFVQRELNYAWEISLEKPRNVIFLIPFRLDNCEVPRYLRSRQWGDYFEDEKERTYQTLLRSLKERHDQKLRLEEEERVRREKAEQEKEAKERAERKAAEKLAQEKAAREKEDKEAKEKAERETAEKAALEKARSEAEERARQIAAKEEERIRKEAIEKRRLPYYETLPSGIPATEKPQPKKTKPPRKPNTTIIVALIGLAGTIVAALLSSPLIERWFSPAPAVTESITITFTLASQSVIPSQTLKPTLINETPTITITPAGSFTPMISPSPIPSAKGSGKIAFVSNRDGNEEIYIMNFDGSEQKRLTQNSNRDIFPQWSPDGTKIAFLSDRDDVNGLYVMNIDGSNQTLLASPVLFGVNSYSWFPDSNKIVFEFSGDNDSALYVASLDGEIQSVLVNTSGISEVRPSVSPNGEKIAFYRNSRLFVVDSSGKNEIEFGKDSVWTARLNWSPDSSKIVFFGLGSLWYDEIFVADLGTRSILQLTENYNRDNSPVWSPDGTQLAFVSSRQDGAYEVFIMDPNGSNVRKITDFHDRQVYLSSLLWSQDGTAIIIQLSRRLNQFETDLNIVKIELGSNETIDLSDNLKFDDYSPALAP